jgi:hypothetical protein
MERIGLIQDHESGSALSQALKVSRIDQEREGCSRPEQDGKVLKRNN